MKIDLKKFSKEILSKVLEKQIKKSEYVTNTTGTVVSPQEIALAIQVIPRSILSFLHIETSLMRVGDTKDLEIPFYLGSSLLGSKLHIEKKAQDSYSGHIEHEGKILTKFKFRSLPGLGLILMSTLELYNPDLLDELRPIKEEMEEVERHELIGHEISMQEEIDKRIMFHHYLQDIVDKKISEREAIDRLVQDKINNHMMHMMIMQMMAQKQHNIEEAKEHEHHEEHEEYEEHEDVYDDEVVKEYENNKEIEEVSDETELKKHSFKDFIKKIEDRKRNSSVQLPNNELVCLECNTTLYKSGDKNIKLCICYGHHMNKNIKLKKKENNRTELKFPKKFDIENIEMLLETIKKNTGE